MAAWRAVGDEGMLDEAAMTGLEVAGEGVLLVRVAGAYHAYQRKCPHMGADLSKGKLQDGVIICPWHGSRFEAGTGAYQEWAPELPGVLVSVGKLFRSPHGLASYPTKVEGGQVWVDVESLEEEA